MELMHLKFAANVKLKKMARVAKQETVKLLRGSKVIELQNMKRGKYFRIMPDVFID